MPKHHQVSMVLRHPRKYFLCMGAGASLWLQGAVGMRKEAVAGVSRRWRQTTRMAIGKVAMIRAQAMAGSATAMRCRMTGPGAGTAGVAPPGAALACLPYSCTAGDHTHAMHVVLIAQTHAGWCYRCLLSVSTCTDGEDLSAVHDKEMSDDVIPCTCDLMEA